VLEFPKNSSRRPARFSIENNKLQIEVSWKGTAIFCSGILPILKERTSKSDLEHEEDWTEVTPELVNSTLVLHEWLKIIRERGLALRPYDDIASAVFSAIYPDQVALGTSKPAAMREETEFFDTWYQQMIVNFPSIHSLCEQQEIDAAIIEFLEQHPRVKDYILSCGRRLGGRRQLFFSPEAGIGTGPPGMTVEDSVAKIAGVSAPLVLHACADGSNEYEILGPTYISGLMGDEPRDDRVETAISTSSQQTITIV
jgi:hypothetical protein